MPSSPKGPGWPACTKARVEVMSSAPKCGSTIWARRLAPDPRPRATAIWAAVVASRGRRTPGSAPQDAPPGRQRSPRLRRARALPRRVARTRGDVRAASARRCGRRGAWRRTARRSGPAPGCWRCRCRPCRSHRGPDSSCGCGRPLRPARRSRRATRREAAAPSVRPECGPGPRRHGPRPAEPRAVATSRARATSANWRTASMSLAACSLRSSARWVSVSFASSAWVAAVWSGPRALRSPLGLSGIVAGAGVVVGGAGSAG